MTAILMTLDEETMCRKIIAQTRETFGADFTTEQLEQGIDTFMGEFAGPRRKAIVRGECLSLLPPLS